MSKHAGIRRTSRIAFMQRPELLHHASPDPSPYTDARPECMAPPGIARPQPGGESRRNCAAFRRIARRWMPPAPPRLNADTRDRHRPLSPPIADRAVRPVGRRRQTAPDHGPSFGRSIDLLTVTRSNSVSSPLPEKKMPRENTYMPSLHAGSAWRNAITLPGAPQGRGRDRARAAAPRLRVTRGRRVLARACCHRASCAGVRTSA